jgi:hypothetical protein
MLFNSPVKPEPLIKPKRPSANSNATEETPPASQVGHW